MPSEHFDCVPSSSLAHERFEVFSFWLIGEVVATTTKTVSRQIKVSTVTLPPTSLSLTKRRCLIYCEVKENVFDSVVTAGFVESLVDHGMESGLGHSKASPYSIESWYSLQHRNSETKSALEQIVCATTELKGAIRLHDENQ